MHTTYYLNIILYFLRLLRYIPIHTNHKKLHLIIPGLGIFGQKLPAGWTGANILKLDINGLEQLGIKHPLHVKKLILALMVRADILYNCMFDLNILIINDISFKLSRGLGREGPRSIFTFLL